LFQILIKKPSSWVMGLSWTSFIINDRITAAFWAAYLHRNLQDDVSLLITEDARQKKAIANRRKKNAFFITVDLIMLF